MSTLYIGDEIGLDNVEEIVVRSGTTDGDLSISEYDRKEIRISPDHGSSIYIHKNHINSMIKALTKAKELWEMSDE